MYPDDANDPDALCESFRESFELPDSDEPIPIEELLRAAGVDLDESHAPACVGHLDTDNPCLHYFDQGPRVTVVRSVGHEGGHLIQQVCGSKHQPDEREFTHLGLTLALPRRLIRRVANKVGWDAHDVLLALGAYPPATVYRRMVEVCGGAAIVRGKKQRVVYGPEYLCRDQVSLWEKRYLGHATEKGHRDLFGVGVWSFERPWPWQVILVPPSALDMLPVERAVERRAR